jgi:RNA polymerase sigma factor (sigma-70 family)
LAGSDQALPAEPVADLAGDSEALTRQLPALIPLALQQLQDGFGLRALRVSDPREAEAALWSACSSFQKHYRDGEFADAETPTELAAQMLRIACNRAQRRHRQDQRIAGQVRHGMTRDEEGQPLAWDPVARGLRPDEEATRNELLAYVRQAIDTIKGELRDRPHALRIVEVYLEDMNRTQEAIATELGINQSTVSRYLEKFRHRIRLMLQEQGLP